MRVEQKYDDNHCIGKEYPMKDETKESEIQAQTFKKSYIFVQGFSLSYCYNIAHAQTTLCIRSCSDCKDFRKRRVFVYKFDGHGIRSWFTITSLLCLMQCGRDLQ